MSTRNLLRLGAEAAKALVLALVFFLLAGQKTFAAPNWTAIQAAMKAPGTEMPGNVLRFELVRQDLTVTVDGQTLPLVYVASVANGFVAFKRTSGNEFFVDGSLPAQETEVAALQTALRLNTHIHITAIVNHVILETPKLIWVHFEATGNGTQLARSVATALETIQNPQVDVSVIPGTNTVIVPSTILPANLLTVFNQGFVEQLTDIFAFYLPRPDENRFTVGGVPAESGLGVGQSFYIQFSFSGGTDITLNIDFALRAGEVQPVEDALRAGGFTITSESNHFVSETPRLFFVHATASGDGLTLGNTLYSVIQIIQADPPSGSLSREEDRE
jgi:hypothetical protein